MRIITGKYKGRNLFLVPGRSTRPTTSFNREVIFSVHQDYEASKVLDLFAGTGSLGLEALSRGASWVDFVEFAPPAISTILKNIELLGVSGDCHLYRKRVESFLADSSAKYDIVFLDPPYRKNLVNPAVKMIMERGLLNPEGLIIVEHDPQELLNPEFAQYVEKEKGSKSSHFTWLRV